MSNAQPSRRQVLAGVGAATTLAAAARAQARGGAGPNILWLVSEDNNPLIGAYGDTLAHTPHLDALAQSGILYRNVYSNAPVCAPSRFGILTGVYPESCSPANHMRAEAKLPALLRTYPEYLRQAGYHCSNNAKTDYNCDVDPRRIWDAQGPEAHWRGRPVGKPFMAVFNHMTTHESMLFKPTPGRVTPGDVRLPAYLPDTPAIRQDYASYYNLIERMDAQIGTRLAELDADGLAEDTIVFYYSDNGGVLPRSKRYCYDEGLRCALVVRVPPKWAHLAPAKPGSDVAAPVSFIDLAPTLLSLAGVPKPATMAGSAFLGQDAGGPQRYAFGMRNRMDERYDFVRTVTDGRYRYIRNYMPHRPCGQNQAFAWLAGGYRDWDRLHRAGQLDEVRDRFFQPRAFEEFYDLKTDPDQVNSLVGDREQAPRIAAMRRALDAHMIAIHDNGFIPEGDPTEGWAPSRVAAAYPLKVLMALASAAARGDPRKLSLFRRRLGDPNGILRYWAATGLLVLGKGAAAAAPDLRRAMESDPSPHVRIVAAEAMAVLGDAAQPVALLADLLAPTHSTPVRLQAINALTYVPDARAALPAIRAAADDEQEYLRNAGGYLTALLESRYDPAVPLFDLERMRRRMGSGG